MLHLFNLSRDRSISDLSQENMESIVKCLIRFEMSSLFELWSPLREQPPRLRAIVSSPDLIVVPSFQFPSSSFSLYLCLNSAFVTVFTTYYSSFFVCSSRNKLHQRLFFLFGCTSVCMIMEMTFLEAWTAACEMHLNESDNSLDGFITSPQFWAA